MLDAPQRIVATGENEYRNTSMPTHIITGFHAIEERVRRAIESGETQTLSITYSRVGPRVKKILELANHAGVSAAQMTDHALDQLVMSLPAAAHDHRGIVLTVAGERPQPHTVDFAHWLTTVADVGDNAMLRDDARHGTQRAATFRIDGGDTKTDSADIGNDDRYHTSAHNEASKLQSATENNNANVRNRSAVIDHIGHPRISTDVDKTQPIAARNNAVASPVRHTVLILDSITDPHNVGAILRSCDQFGVSLVIMPQRRGVSNVDGNDIIARTSAGASNWVPVTVVPNLVRAAHQLKAAGFWLYAADAGGETVQRISFAPKSAIIMGSEGSGISRLLKNQCDSVVSIPTCGKIDSLNVSVAAGVLLYEVYRQSQQSF